MLIGIYSDQVARELSTGKQQEDIKVDTRLSVFKPLGVKWLTSAYDYLRLHKEIVVNVFHKVAINGELLAVSNSDEEDPVNDLD